MRARRVPALLLALAALAPERSAHAQTEHQQVFVLHSTRRDSQFVAVAESVLPRRLDTGLDRNLDYYAEYIDLSRFPDPAYTNAFREFLRQKYQTIRFDLVIAMQDAAVEFVTKDAELFRDTPAVLLANEAAVPPRPNSTGLFQPRDFASTIAVIRRLQPDVEHVFVVTGAAASDKAYEAAARGQLEAVAAGLNVAFLSGLGTRELEERLARLPPRSAVYHLLVTEDGDGHRYHPLDYVDRVTAAANAPTYSWVDSALGHGIVGGSLYSQAAVVERVGEIALRVLRGERPDSIPVAMFNANAVQVDWRQLRRWRIDEARVPPDAIVHFREPGIWDQYRTHVLAVLMLLITQSLLIAGLLVQRSRRRRAEDELRESQRELRDSFERIRALGARLLSAQETERARIARELHDDICQRMLLLTIELQALERSHPGAAPAAEALTVAKDIAKSLHELSHRLHPTRLRVIGLVGALDRLCHEVSRAGLTITYTHEGVPPALEPELTLCLFRVVQEALQNAIKYSQASQVSVELRGNANGLTLSVADDGVGFDVGAELGKGVGLLSMIERVEAAGGMLDIRSAPGAGTSLLAIVPLQARASLRRTPLAASGAN